MKRFFSMVISMIVIGASLIGGIFLGITLVDSNYTQKKTSQAVTEKQVETETEVRSEVETESEEERKTETEKASESTAETEVITEAGSGVEISLGVPVPEIDEQLITVNEWSRPGTHIEKVKYIVIHYLGNPGTTAQENRDYFEGLKDYHYESMSANYVIGLEGEIIQCVPDDEVAFASNNANRTSISIENCHVDNTGRFQESTYISLVQLTAYLMQKYDLSRDDIIRHYDVTGKMCPLYYCVHEDAWEMFIDDVMLYCDLCNTDPEALSDLESRLKGVNYTYLNKYSKQ